MWCNEKVFGIYMGGGNIMGIFLVYMWCNENVFSIYVGALNLNYNLRYLNNLSNYLLIPM